MENTSILKHISEDLLMLGNMKIPTENGVSHLLLVTDHQEQRQRDFIQDLIQKIHQKEAHRFQIDLLFL